MLLKATLDPLTREIQLDSHTLVAVEHDFNVSGIKFTVPNSVGIDIPFKLSDSIVRIMYKSPTITNYYQIRDFKLNDTTASFTWTFDRNVTDKPGDCYFSVCGIISGQDGVIEKEWHSVPAKIKIGSTIHTLTLTPSKEEEDAIAYLTRLISNFLPGNDGTERQVLMKIGDGTRWEDPIMVSNTQGKENGTKIAALLVANEKYDLYAPKVEVTPSVSEGTEIGVISVGGESETLYAAVDTDDLDAALTEIYGE